MSSPWVASGAWIVLAPVLLAQDPPASRPTSLPTPERGPVSPADEAAFDALHKEFLQELGAVSKLQQKQRQGDTLTDAERRSLEFHRKRIKDLSLALARLMAPPFKEEKLAAAPERPLAGDEEKLRQRADVLARATLEDNRIPHLGRGRVDYGETILLDHPSLAALPGFRFYLAKLDISPEVAKAPAKAHAGKAHGNPPKRFQYQLLSYDLAKDKVKHYYGFGHQHVVRPLLATGRVRVKDRATAKRLAAAIALLGEASRGANIFSPPKGPKGLTRAELDKRFFLGRYADQCQPHPARVVDTDKQRILVLYGLSCDDWHMPVRVWFELFHFDLATGHYLGTEKRGHKPALPADTRLDSDGVNEAVTALEKELQTANRSR